MSYIEIPVVRSMNDDANFDADVKFDNKETNRRLTTHGGIQDVNASDEVTDEAFMRSTAFFLVSQEEFGRCK